MFTGIQILEPRIFEYVPRGVFSHSTVDVYPRAIERGERVAAHVATGYWYELSTIRRYLDTSVALMRAEGRSVELGKGSHIEPGAEVADAVLWEDCQVKRGARVRGAVLGAGVCVRRGEVFEDCAVVRAALVEASERPAKALAGEARGDNFVVKLAR
jgi:NDP-sugar pyrophosphorylase family protein